MTILFFKLKTFVLSISGDQVQLLTMYLLPHQNIKYKLKKKTFKIFFMKSFKIIYFLFSFILSYNQDPISNQILTVYLDES